ncbi:MAG: hypothetical protein KGS72_24690 [Cyanobacteria bacterium REEB67]|nr:hypothetical protein [Cyanobacteria bacterium REEB67]
MLGCFLAAFCACFLQYQLTVWRGETNLMLVFDSGHYLDTAQQIISAVSHCLAGQALSDIDKRALAQSINLDGPLLPGVAALLFCTIGKAFALRDFLSLLTLQSIFHGFSAVVLFSLAARLLSPGDVDSSSSSSSNCSIEKAGFGDLKWPLGTALIWAFSPVAVLASQRFLTESLAALLVLVFLYLLISLHDYLQGALKIGFRPGLTAYVCGLAAVLLAFVKTGLLPVIALALISVFVGTRQARAKAPSGAALAFFCLLGISTLILSWAALTANLTGQATILPQRAPILNLFVGWNFDNDGFSTLPVAPVAEPLARVYEASGSAPLAVAKLIVSRPLQSSSLLLRKIPRLCSLPWNDFRRAALFVSPKIMQILHQYILVLALAGICLAVAGGAPPLIWYALLLSIGHGIFLLFETIPRYAFSAYPLLYLFASYFLHRMPARGRVRSLVLLAVIVVASNTTAPALLMRNSSPLLALSFIALCSTLLVVFILRLLQSHVLRILPSLSARKLQITFALLSLLFLAVQMAEAFYNAPRAEWEAKLEAGDLARSEISLGGRAGRRAFLLIDAARQMERARVTLNGQALDVAVNLFDLYAERREHFSFAEQVVALMGRSSADLRRWWVIPIPPEILKCGSTNVVEVTAGGPLRLFGDYGADSILPGFLYVSPGRIWTTNDAFEWRCGIPFAAWGERHSACGNFSLSRPGGGKVRGDAIASHGCMRLLIVVDEGGAQPAATMPSGDFKKSGFTIY